MARKIVKGEEFISNKFLIDSALEHAKDAHKAIKVAIRYISRAKEETKEFSTRAGCWWYSWPAINSRLHFDDVLSNLEDARKLCPTIDDFDREFDIRCC